MITEVIIAVGHQPIFAQYLHVAERFHFHMDKMAAQRKRVCTSSSQSSAKKAKRQVGVSTFEKWQREFEREYQSLLWLRCDKDDVNRSLVATLYCEVCQQFKDRIQGMRNFSPAWLTGSTNHQLWWADRTRRPNQGARKEYRPRATDTVSESSDSEPEEFALDDWDRLFTD